VLSLGELFMINDLKDQGLSIQAIAQRTEMDRKTVRKYLQQGLSVPTYGPREPRPSKLDAFRPWINVSATIRSSQGVGC
jgi:transposase